MPKTNLARARRAAAQQLESLQRAGVSRLGKPRPGKNQKAPSADAPVKKEAPLSKTAVAERLEILRKKVARCTRCQELAESRQQTVFGDGDPKARLVFVGEAPGADEDKQGVPFVGRAGQLLTKIIEACQLTREQVYIGNVLKCRPPNNRPPEPEEIENCREYLDEQLALIRPEFVCCLGSTAARRVLGLETPIGKLRGRFYDLDGMQVICTYHPSYLLRNPAAKKDVWEDMKLLMAKMGIKLT